MGIKNRKKKMLGGAETEGRRGFSGIVGEVDDIGGFAGFGKGVRGNKKEAVDVGKVVTDVFELVIDEYDMVEDHRHLTGENVVGRKADEGSEADGEIKESVGGRVGVMRGGENGSGTLAKKKHGRFKMRVVGFRRGGIKGDDIGRGRDMKEEREALHDGTDRAESDRTGV